MKISEIIQPSIATKSRMIQESWINDPDQPFSEGQLQVIAENVVRAESSNNWQKFDTVDSLMEWLNQNSK